MQKKKKTLLVVTLNWVNTFKISIFKNFKREHNIFAYKTGIYSLFLHSEETDIQLVGNLSVKKLFPINQLNFFKINNFHRVNIFLMITTMKASINKAASPLIWGTQF